MILFQRAGDLAGWLKSQKEAGKSIGFVPTMGALHAGHISLIDISKKATDLAVCSIFVNPTQFNDPKDFSKYPVTIEKDIFQLEQAGTDVLFLPEVTDMYPGGTNNLETYDLGRLETLLEGKYRPGHFQGVCQVMRRLLDTVEPGDLFMGQKDYQQCMVIRRLLELRGYSTRLHPCPIVREPDGLAMSSRNMRLTEADRKKATAIYQALTFLKAQWEGPASAGKMEEWIHHAKALLEKNDFRVDYVEIADARTLGSLSAKPYDGEAIALVAAFQGEVRLIDNMLLS